MPQDNLPENEHFYAVYDANPETNGHALVISKKHVESFFELNKDEVNELYELLSKIKIIVDNKFHPDGYNVGVNDGQVAGQTIFHLHIHLIPRYKGDTTNPRGGVRNLILEKNSF